ncbi:hypothetical protein ACFY1S_13375 [Micromonospora sp. NPDC000663]|uniref:hypothetical protein n=1 Tax=Micromonospora sp. NPDC000663 TaxID=3364218 RepID=UPI0036B4BBA8
MPRMVLRRLVAVVAVSVVTSCASSTAQPVDQAADETKPTTATLPATGGSGYSAALSARLVNSDSLPPGFAVDIATVMAQDAGDNHSGGASSCTHETIPLLSARRLTGTPSAMAAATLSHDVGPDDFWVGTEVIRTYADDGARRAMADLRAFIDRCPTVSTSGQLGGGSHRYAAASGPRLGDESVHVSCTATSTDVEALKCDVLLVRIGTTLLVIQEEGNKPGNDELLTQVAEAALRRYQSTGS